jgi:DNA segregation ATPase FtsK/SpoIIIE-like protein
VVIDELADLLMVGGQGLQRALTRLLQRGRGVGIHVVAATQKPTAAVLGSLVKANFPVRLVGRVASGNDARVASGWSGTGAERLEGRGDFVAVAEGRVTRFQAAHVAPEEIREVVGGGMQGSRAERWAYPEPVPPVPSRVEGPVSSAVERRLVEGSRRRASPELSRGMEGEVLLEPVGRLKAVLKGRGQR